MNRFFLFSLGLFFASANAQAQIDLKEIESKLKGEGLSGWVHGSVKDRWLFVFTYRNPKDFFDFLQFPLLPTTEATLEQLKALKRNDKILLKGQFGDQEAPIKHIEVSEIKILKAIEEPRPMPEYTYGTQIPKDLLDKTEIVVRVHAVADEGKVLVVEYGDQIIPVFVKDNSLTKTFYRGDKIRFKYVLRKKPKQPTHIEPNPNVAQPFEFLEHVVEGHGKPVTKEGMLVFFPKSPQISMNIFALQHLDQDGVALEYTLVNFEDPEMFKKILEKLQAAWDKNEKRAENGRNKWLNRTIRVKATGILNVVNPSQANPQILLKSPEDVQVEALP